VLVVLGAIFLLLIGILTFGLGSILMLGGALIAGLSTTSDVEGLPIVGAFAGLVTGLAFLIVFWGLLEVIASIGMFIHRGWGRVLGLIVAVVGALFTGLGLVASLGAADQTAGGIGVSLVLFAGYAFTVLALVVGAEHFRRA
jgi:hypothetical protein